MPRQLTTAEFVERARKVHGGRYDYSQTEYGGAGKKIKIICSVHGMFVQRPDDHLQAKGCQKCGFESRRAKRSKGLDGFIRDAREVHGDEYDYSLVDYASTHSKVTVVCPQHGPWKVTPANHISNASGCPKCYGRNRITEDYIAEARKAHGDRYDYSQTVYIDARTKVTIICPEHGPFTQKAVSHMTGKGCKKCGDEESSDKRRLSTEQFIADAKAVHGDTYDYSAVDYRSNRAKIQIVCKRHGPFLQRPGSHVRGDGCPGCKAEAVGDRSRDTAEDFIEKARTVHGDKYDYSQVEYRNNRTKVRIICPEHGPFEQAPDNHSSGQGCPACGGVARLDTEEFIHRATTVHGDRYGYGGATYHNLKSKVQITCPEHGDFAQTAGDHLNGSGCPGCAQGGFDATQPGIVYYIRVDTRNQTVYKVGITNRSVRQRFGASDREKITILHREYFENGIEAIDRERELLRQYREYKYQGETLLKDVGTAEMFARDVLGLDTGTKGIAAAESKPYKPEYQEIIKK